MSRWQSLLFWLASLLMGATGGIFAWMKYLLSPSDPYSVVNHPWQPFFHHAHVVIAPIWIFSLGVVVVIHLLPRMEAGAEPGRRTGKFLTLLCAGMVVSGYAIQVITAEPFLKWGGYVHLGIGTLFMIILIVHHVATLLQRRANEKLLNEIE